MQYDIDIPAAELDLTAVRASGPGGQNVNKVATAVQLRFDIHASKTLPECIKQRLLDKNDRRINAAGIVVIKAQKYRTQDRNREDAINRLQSLIASVAVTAAPRKRTRPTQRSKAERLENKRQRGKVKKRRAAPIDDRD